MNAASTSLMARPLPSLWAGLFVGEQAMPKVRGIPSKTASPEHTSSWAREFRPTDPLA
jgi:hypothetical protein